MAVWRDNDATDWAFLWECALFLVASFYVLLLILNASGIVELIHLFFEDKFLFDRY